MKTFLKVLLVLAGLGAALVALASYFEKETRPRYISIYGEPSEDEAC